MNNIMFTQKTPAEIEHMIAGRICQIRKRRKLSQKKLSEKSGVSLGSLKQFEQRGEISLPSLIKIAIALDIHQELEQPFMDVPLLSIEEIIFSAGAESISTRYGSL